MKQLDFEVVFYSEELDKIITLQYIGCSQVIVVDGIWDEIINSNEIFEYSYDNGLEFMGVL